jgi:glycosyltransferase involved in cell wall biosynthesis
MNILFVHEVEWIKKVVFEMHNLAEGLSLLGHRVYAIDYGNRWQRDNPFDFGNFKTTEVKSLARAYPKASVCLRRPGFIKIPGLSRLSAAFSHYFEIQRTIREKDIDIIVLLSAPTNGLQTIYLARKFGIPVVFRSLDILNQLVVYPLLRPPTRIFERKVYSSVDMILTITPKLSSYVIKMGANPKRVKLLPVLVDTALFRPLPNPTRVRQKWGYTERDKVVVFIGTLSEFSGLDGLIGRFQEVVEQIPEAKLLIVGDGPQRPKLEAVINEFGLRKQVTITGLQPYNTVPQYINLAAICIAPFRPTGVTRDIFPSKIVQYLACGKVVLATPLPGTRAVIAGERQGVVYADGPQKMAKEMVSLLRSAERRRKLGSAGLHYARKVHGHDVIIRQLEARLQEAIKKKQGVP